MTVEFYHVIDLPDGGCTPGRVDLRGEPAYLGLDAPGLLMRKRVLDVAANDGFWAFWAERTGAREVVATDVEGYAGYDWGFDGPPSDIGQYGQQNKRKAFDHLKQLMRSNVDRRSASCYDLNPKDYGSFDLVLVYGLIYHLRHPLLAIDAVRSVCHGAVVIETHTQPAETAEPQSLFYWDDVIRGSHTAWSGPTASCVVAWLRSAGFPFVFYETQRKRPDRVRVVGAITPEWREVFAASPNLTFCDDGYYERTRQAVRGALTY